MSGRSASSWYIVGRTPVYWPSSAWPKGKGIYLRSASSIPPEFSQPTATKTKLQSCNHVWSYSHWHRHRPGRHEPHRRPCAHSSSGTNPSPHAHSHRYLACGHCTSHQPYRLGRIHQRVERCSCQSRALLGACLAPRRLYKSVFCVYR